MFKANDTVFVRKVGGLSGRVVDYNPITQDVRVLHRIRHNSWLQVKYNGDYIEKSRYPLSWDITTPFVTPTPTFLSRALSFIGLG
jgi:hypothetical protein